MHVPTLWTLLGKGCKSSLLGLETQLCPAWGCVVHQVLSWGQRRAQPGWHSRASLQLLALPGIAVLLSRPWHLTGHCHSMEGLWARGVLLLSCLLLPSPAGSQTSPSPDRRLQMDPEEAPSQHHAAR